MLTIEQEDEIIAAFRGDPFSNVAVLARQYFVSEPVIKRLLIAHGIRCRRSAFEEDLTEDHRVYRIAFCETLLETWDHATFQNIVFSDEKAFSTDVSWRNIVYRPANTRHHQPYVKRKRTSGRITDAFWGCITADGPGELLPINGRLTSPQYVQIIANHIVPMMNDFEGEHIYMHDNSPVHTAGIVGEYLAEQAFETMMWPPFSPDLNPIENVWSSVTKDWPVFDRRDHDTLQAVVEERWNRLKDMPGKFSNLSILCEKMVTMHFLPQTILITCMLRFLVACKKLLIWTATGVVTDKRRREDTRRKEKKTRCNRN